MARTTIDIPLPDLTGRRAVLTGGSDGIGLVIARRLAASLPHTINPVCELGTRAVVELEQRARDIHPGPVGQVEITRKTGDELHRISGLPHYGLTQCGP